MRIRSRSAPSMGVGVAFARCDVDNWEGVQGVHNQKRKKENGTPPVRARSAILATHVARFRPVVALPLQC